MVLDKSVLPPKALTAWGTTKQTDMQRQTINDTELRIVEDRFMYPAPESCFHLIKIGSLMQEHGSAEVR